MVALTNINRHKTHAVKVGNVTIGGNAPIVVQSMTNTDTADALATFKQVKDLYLAGSEIVRITVNNEAAAKSVATICELLYKEGLNIRLANIHPLCNLLAP